jgi:hypothetical protein
LNCYRIAAFALLVVSQWAVTPALAAESERQCVAAAQDLQATFDRSIVKGWQLKFYARGEECDVLHVESHTNLGKPSMEALAKGTMLYRKVLPGGVNKYAFAHGFTDVVYSNVHNAKSVSYGSQKLDKAAVKKLKRCAAGGKQKGK